MPVREVSYRVLKIGAYHCGYKLLDDNSWEFIKGTCSANALRCKDRVLHPQRRPSAGGIVDEFTGLVEIPYVREKRKSFFARARHWLRRGSVRKRR